MGKILSIIVPSYNMEKYLGQALESCIVQDEAVRGLYEVIVVNDGSKDSTQAVADKYEHKYSDIFRVINKENGGYGSAINAGVKEAYGKYLKILDADDWYNTDALCNLLHKLVTTDCDMIITNFETVNEKTGDSALKQFELTEDTVFDLTDIGLPLSALYMHSVCYKTEIFKQNNIQLTEHCFYTDTQYVLFPLKYANAAIYYGINLYEYRIGREGQSVSFEGVKKHLHDYEIVINAVNTYFGDGIGDNRDSIEGCIARIYTDYVWQLMRFPCNHKNKQCVKKWLEEVAEKYTYGYSCFENKKLYLLRKSHYVLYRPCSWYAKHIESKKI